MQHEGEPVLDRVITAKLTCEIPENECIPVVRAEDSPHDDVKDLGQLLQANAPRLGGGGDWMLETVTSRRKASWSFGL